jgi:hypothetical protein
MYPKPFPHQFTVSSKKNPMQDLKQKFVVLASYWVSVQPPPPHKILSGVFNIKSVIDHLQPNKKVLVLTDFKHFKLK